MGRRDDGKVFRPAPYCYRCPFQNPGVGPPAHSYPECGLACAEALEVELLRQGPDAVAAFIAEPVVGATLAAAVPPQEYWPRVRRICDQYGVLLIADEVMTGFGRTGRWFAVNHWDVMPDILVAAKGASGGYFPLGVVLLKGALARDILGGADDFTHGFTYANGVMGAAVGMAVLRYLQDHDLVATSARMGEHMMRQLGTLNDSPVVGDVRGLGLMAGVELVADKGTRAPIPREERVVERAQAAALARGVNVYVGTGMADGLNGDAVLIGPPFVITEGQIDALVSVLRDVLQGIARSLGPLGFSLSRRGSPHI